MFTFYVLHRCQGLNSLNIYPWVHSGSNFISNKDQVMVVSLPDVDPSSISSNSKFTMAAGDFLEVFVLWIWKLILERHCDSYHYNA